VIVVCQAAPPYLALTWIVTRRLWSTLLAQDVDVRHVATKARCVSAASMDLGYHKMLGRTANLGRIQFGHS
jgi:hypothetical protein